jgi:ABC-type hemin transport system ATPase subunit
MIVAAPAGSGKSSALLTVHELTAAPLINVNLELSRRMLDLSERQRTLYLSRLLAEVVNRPGAGVVLLDNMEMLFDVTLKQDPLRLLQGLSRNRTLVVAWNGASDGKQLTYATPEHPEYRRYPCQDFLLVLPQPFY